MVADRLSQHALDVAQDAILRLEQLNDVFRRAHRQVGADVENLGLELVNRVGAVVIEEQDLSHCLQNARLSEYTIEILLRKVVHRELLSDCLKECQLVNWLQLDLPLHHLVQQVLHLLFECQVLLKDPRRQALRYPLHELFTARHC